MSDVINHNNLPNAVQQIFNKVDNIEQLLLENSKRKEYQDQWYDVNGLSEYLPGHPAPPTIYGWVSNRKIPHKKFGKRLAFLRSEIDLWLKSQRRKTISEIDNEVENILVSKKS